MSHHLEERGEVVLRLPGGARLAQTEGGEILLEPDEDFLPAGRGQIKAGVRRYLGLTPAFIWPRPAGRKSSSGSSRISPPSVWARRAPPGSRRTTSPRSSR